MSVDADVLTNPNGVIYALGGFSGGPTLYVKDGTLSYEYNLFEIQRTLIKAKDRLPTGKVKIEVETSYVERRPAGPLKVVLKVNGKEVASGVVPVSAPLIFTANDCLDFGIDLGSPVGIEYYDQAPSNSTARSKVRVWNTSVPPLRCRKRNYKRMDRFQRRTKQGRS